MNSRWLKLLALVFMTVDHVGALLFPNVVLLRIIGRLAFPLFAFLVAYGSIKTRNPSLYFLRLIAFACFLQILWFLIPGADTSFSNVFFTLAFGEFAIMIICLLRKGAPINGTAGKIVFVCIAGAFAIIISLLGSVLGVEYGAPGVLLIVMFYAVLKNRENVEDKITAVMCRILDPVLALVVFNVAYMVMYDWTIQWWSCLSAVMLWFFIDTKLKISIFEKYTFYIYYPLHFIAIYLVGLIFF